MGDATRWVTLIFMLSLKAPYSDLIWFYSACNCNMKGYWLERESRSQRLVGANGGQWGPVVALSKDTRTLFIFCTNLLPGRGLKMSLIWWHKAIGCCFREGDFRCIQRAQNNTYSDINIQALEVETNTKTNAMLVLPFSVCPWCWAEQNNSFHSFISQCPYLAGCRGTVANGCMDLFGLVWLFNKTLI